MNEFNIQEEYVEFFYDELKRVERAFSDSEEQRLASTSIRHSHECFMKILRSRTNKNRFISSDVRSELGFETGYIYIVRFDCYINYKSRAFVNTMKKYDGSSVLQSLIFEYSNY